MAPWIFRDVVSEVKGRLLCYKDDWIDGWRCGFKILAPSVYIFCASALPALAFGQQLAEDTDGTLTVVHVLVSTALSGLMQSILGGQPLLIVGVAEPIVIIYGFMYDFLDGRSGAPDFLAWAAWVCVWTAIILVFLAALNSGKYIMYATGLSGETFGLLIAILFLQQAVKGTISEFRPPPLADRGVEDPENADWLSNGLWAIIIGTGLLLTSLLLHSARSWTLFTHRIRSFLADYGAPIMAIVWSAAAYIAADSLPGGEPRQTNTPNTWEVKDSWAVTTRMGDVDVDYVFMAMVPAFIIAMLFWFDHGVSSLLAQEGKFGLARPPAYSWDLLLLAFITLACGLLGIPPINGVLPQAPMHTTTLVTLKKEVKLAELRKASAPNSTRSSFLDTLGAIRYRLGLGGSPSSLKKACLHQVTSAPVLHPPSPKVNAPAGSRMELQLQDSGTPSNPHVDHGVRRHHHEGVNGLEDGGNGYPPSSTSGVTRAHVYSDAASNADDVHSVTTNEGALNVVDERTPPLQLILDDLRAHENRVSNFIQSILCAVTLFCTPVIQYIPTSVLWGYFAYMALVSLAGNSMWERMVLILSDPKIWRKYKKEKKGTTTWFIIIFTLCQLAFLMGIMCLVTWAGIAGVAFPVPILIIMPVRVFLLPKILSKGYMEQLTILDPLDV